MRAAIFTAADSPLEIESVEPPTPSPKDVVVNLGASGVCHSDLSVLNGTLPVPPPLLFGHEGAGTVEWVGSEVTRVRPGDRVVASITPVCGRCWHCTRQETHLCDAGAEVGTSKHVTRADGSTAMALSGLGTFAEAMTCSELSLVPVQTDLPDEILALIGCGVTTGLGAALNTAEVRPGQSVAVIGVGGVGMSVLQGARAGGAATIIAIDPVADKREAALRLGATDVVDPAAGDPIEQVKALTDGRGVDTAFEAVGIQALMEQAMAMTRNGGTTVFVGIPGLAAMVPVSGIGLVMSGKAIKGSYYGGAQALRDIPRFISLQEKGRIDLEAMVSRRFPLDGVNDAFDLMRSGEVIRSVLTL